MLKRLKQLAQETLHTLRMVGQAIPAGIALWTEPPVARNLKLQYKNVSYWQGVPGTDQRDLLSLQEL